MVLTSPALLRSLFQVRRSETGEGEGLCCVRAHGISTSVDHMGVAGARRRNVVSLPTDHVSEAFPPRPLFVAEPSALADCSPRGKGMHEDESSSMVLPLCSFMQRTRHPLNGLVTVSVFVAFGVNDVHWHVLLIVCCLLCLFCTSGYSVYLLPARIGASK